MEQRLGPIDSSVNPLCKSEILLFLKLGFDVLL